MQNNSNPPLDGLDEDLRIVSKFLSGSLSIDELNSIPSFGGLFRNLEEIVSPRTGLIDAGSLWFKKADTLILVDDDQFVSIAFPDSGFYRL